MTCTRCGFEELSTANFCKQCGRRMRPLGNVNGQLVRSWHGRMVAGVCAGFAEQYGLDVSLVRIVFALVTFTTGVPLLAYAVAWVVIPNAPYALPVQAAGSYGGAGAGTMGQ